MRNIVKFRRLWILCRDTDVQYCHIPHLNNTIRFCVSVEVFFRCGIWQYSASEEYNHITHQYLYTESTASYMVEGRGRGCGFCVEIVMWNIVIIFCIWKIQPDSVSVTLHRIHSIIYGRHRGCGFCVEITIWNIVIFRIWRIQPDSVSVTLHRIHSIIYGKGRGCGFCVEILMGNMVVFLRCEIWQYSASEEYNRILCR